MSENNNIKHKIKALLSKTTDNGATEAEMESALKKANELMIQYFISEHDIKEEGNKTKCVSKKFKIVKSGYTMRLFLYELSQLFDCEHYYTKDDIYFFGYEQDVDMCGYFYYVIINSCLYEKELYKKSVEYNILSTAYNGKTICNSFIKGFIDKVALKLEELYNDKNKTLSESYEVAVIDKKNIVKSEYDLLNMKIVTAPIAKINVVRDSYYNGMDRANNFELNKGVEYGNSKSVAI